MRKGREKEMFLIKELLRYMKRICLLLSLVVSFTVSSCQDKMRKYDWIPTECAPKNYPIQIYKGDFYYGDKGRIYIPDGRAVDIGWGEMGSVNIAGDKLKEAPHTLELTWISFTEKKNYKGRFELDTKKNRFPFCCWLS